MSASAVDTVTLQRDVVVAEAEEWEHIDGTESSSLSTYLPDDNEFVQFMYSEVFGSATANWNTGGTSEIHETLNVRNENKGIIPYQKPERTDTSFACFRNDTYVDGDTGNAEPRAAIFCQQNKPKRPPRVCVTSDNNLDPGDHQAYNGKTENKEPYRSLGAGTSIHATSFSELETFQSATQATNNGIHSPVDVDRNYSYLEGVESELFVQTSPTTPVGHAPGPTVKTGAISDGGNVRRSVQAIDLVSMARQQKEKTPLRKDINIEDIEQYRGNFSPVEAAKCIEFLHPEAFGSTNAKWSTGSTTEIHETLNVMNKNEGIIPRQEPERNETAFACDKKGAYVDRDTGNAAGTSTHTTSCSKQETFQSATQETNMDIHSPIKVDGNYSCLECVSELSVQAFPTTPFGHASRPIVQTDAVSGGNIHRSAQAIGPVSRVRQRNKGKTPLRKEINVEDIEQYRGNFSLIEAAKCIGVSKSTLKRRCRDLKIPHWDRHRENKDEHLPSKKSIHASGASTKPEEPFPKRPKTAIEEVPQNNQRGVLDDSPTWQSVNSMVLKVRHGAKMFRFEICSSSTMDILEGEVGKRINLEVGKFIIRYKDEEGDWISLTCNDDWQCCMNTSGSQVKIDVLVEPRND